MVRYSWYPGPPMRLRSRRGIPHPHSLAGSHRTACESSVWQVAVCRKAGSKEPNRILPRPELCEEQPGFGSSKRNPVAYKVESVTGNQHVAHRWTGPPRQKASVSHPEYENGETTRGVGLILQDRTKPPASGGRKTGSPDCKENTD